MYLINWFSETTCRATEIRTYSIIHFISFYEKQIFDVVFSPWFNKKNNMVIKLSWNIFWESINQLIWCLFTVYIFVGRGLDMPIVHSPQDPSPPTFFFVQNIYIFTFWMLTSIISGWSWDIGVYWDPTGYWLFKFKFMMLTLRYNRSKERNGKN